jgi:hypothetical protein
MGRSAGNETKGSDRESLYSDVNTGEGAIIVEWGMPLVSAELSRTLPPGGQNYNRLADADPAC